MFDSSLPDPAALRRVDDAALVGAITGWMRVSAAAEARAMVGIAELVRRRCTDEHPDWACDDWDAAAAEVSAALTVSHGRASGLMDLAVTLRDRLPKVGALLVAGDIDARMVATIAERTYLVHDEHALVELDEKIAERAVAWGPLSKYKLTQALDVWVDSIDPAAVRRTRSNARHRHFTVGDPDEQSGTTAVWGRLSAADAALFDRRVQVMAQGVCEDDPRTTEQRRTDAIGALGAGSFHLACACGSPVCPASADDGRASNVFVYVVAEQESLAAEPDPGIHGEEPKYETRLRAQSRPTPQPQPESEPDSVQPSPASAQQPSKPERKQQQPEQPGQSAQPDPKPSVRRKPAVIPGGGIVPAPLLADLIARGAKIIPVRTPGPDPEPRYRPSAALDRFVRTRDLTCRFPGCDRPADRSDLDHTIPYPQGFTHASGLGCKCRKHHLLKTFWDGWSEQQLPDGTIIFTTPTGLTYLTKPGAALLFPGWDTSTPPPGTPDPPGSLRDQNTSEARTLMMPKRKRTRAQARAARIKAERALNDAYLAERNIPPPF